MLFLREEWAIVKFPSPFFRASVTIPDLLNCTPLSLINGKLSINCWGVTRFIFPPTQLQPIYSVIFQLLDDKKGKWWGIKTTQTSTSHPSLRRGASFFMPNQPSMGAGEWISRVSSSSESLKYMESGKVGRGVKCEKEQMNDYCLVFVNVDGLEQSGVRPECWLHVERWLHVSQWGLLGASENLAPCHLEMKADAAFRALASDTGDLGSSPGFPTAFHCELKQVPLGQICKGI